MGCDIHTYIEYKGKGSDKWASFGGRINPGRYYSVFANLAGIRCYGEKPPMLIPRGIPSDISWDASSDWWCLINDEYANDDNDYVTTEQAERWSKYGSKIEERNGKPFRVQGPDWHTPSWVTADELEQAIPGEGFYEYQAILAAMRSFEAQDLDCRLVFWFDN